MFRGLFLIDPKGNIRHCLINDLPIGRSVNEALRTLKALQFFEKNGEGKLKHSINLFLNNYNNLVCPADWTEEKPTINTKSPQEYFNKVNKK